MLGGEGLIKSVSTICEELYCVKAEKTVPTVSQSMKLSLAKNDKINSYNVNVEIKSVSDPQAQPHFLTNGKWLKNTSKIILRVS